MSVLFAFRSSCCPSSPSCARLRARPAATLQSHRSATSRYQQASWRRTPPNVASEAYSLTCAATYSFSIHLARCTSLRYSGHSDTGHMSTSSGAAVTPFGTRETVQRLSVPLGVRDATQCAQSRISDDASLFLPTSRYLAHVWTPENLPFPLLGSPVCVLRPLPHLARFYTCISTCDAWAPAGGAQASSVGDASPPPSALRLRARSLSLARP